MDQRKSFTVMGVVAGPHPYRVHLHVRAYSAQEAIGQAHGELNNEELTRNRTSKWTLLAAAVFDGELHSAHSHGGSVGLIWADDRYGIEREDLRKLGARWFTSVYVDPCNHKVFVHKMKSLCAGNVERHKQFDFQLIAGIAACESEAVYLYEPLASQHRSSRDSRIRAMAQDYNPGYLKYLPTDLPLHEPIIKGA